MNSVVKTKQCGTQLLPMLRLMLVFCFYGPIFWKINHKGNNNLTKIPLVKFNSCCLPLCNIMVFHELWPVGVSKELSSVWQFSWVIWTILSGFEITCEFEWLCSRNCFFLIILKNVTKNIPFKKMVKKVWVIWTKNILLQKNGLKSVSNLDQNILLQKNG